MTKDILITDEMLNALRTLYLDEKDQDLKRVWLQLGKSLKNDLDNGELSPLDEVDKKIISRLFNNNE